MRRLYIQGLILLVLFCSNEATAQQSVAIGTTTPDPSAVLLLIGNGSQGLIIPITGNVGGMPTGSSKAGMIVYNSSDKKVYYYDGTNWGPISGGVNGTDSQTLTINGNTISISNGNSQNLAGGAPSVVGQVFMWDGGKWTSSSGTAPATNQVLMWNGTTWAPSTLSSGGTVTSVTGTAPISVLTGTSTPAISLVPGGITNSLLATNSVNASTITDGSITAADLSSMGAVNSGQVLQWNGTSWAPATLTSGGDMTKAVYDGNNDNIVDAAALLTSTLPLTGGGTGATTAAAARTNLGLGTLSTLSTITSAEITDAAITAADLNSMSAASGQVLQYNGTAWVPTTIAAGGDMTKAIYDTNNDNVVDAATTASTLSATLAIASGGTGATTASLARTNLGLGTLSTLSTITSSEITDATIAAVDLSSMSATNGQILQYNGSTWVPTTLPVGGDLLSSNNLSDLANVVTARTNIGLGSLATLSAVSTTEITDGTIVAADLNSMSASTGQVLTYNGTNWAPASGGSLSSTLTSANIFVGNGSNIATGVAMSGDATVSNTGAVTLSNSSATRTNLGLGSLATLSLVTSTEITDGTITGTDINNMSATSGQVLTYNGTTWAPATSGGLSSSLTSANIFVGSGSNIATGVVMSGDASISNAGAVTLSNSAATRTNLGLGSLATLNAVTNSEITDGSITGADIAPGTINTDRLAPGTNGQVLTTSAGVATWATGFTNPMTTPGDIIYGGAGGLATRLATGTGFLKGGATPSYSAVDLASADVIGALPLASGGTGASTAAAALTNLGALGTSLNSGNIFVGSAGNLATGVAMSGDATIINTGALTISNTATTGGNIINSINANGSATINGARVNPTFGTQNISTSGTLNSGAITATNLASINTVSYTWPSVQGAANTVLTNNGTGTLSWAAPLSGWSLTGNAGTNPATNFIGTTDIQDLVFKTNNLESMRILSSGHTGIGTTPLVSTRLLVSQIGANSSNHGVFATSSGGTTANTGVFGSATGSGTSANFGGDFSGTGGGSGIGSRSTGSGGSISNFGIEASASGSAPDNIGVYAHASGGGNNWAGYFDQGNVHITNGLSIGATPGTFGTAGQVLTSAGSGVPPTWSSASGFSTLNTIPKGDGATLVASNIFENGGLVGIGVSTPTTDLVLANNVSYPVFTLSTSSTAAAATPHISIVTGIYSNAGGTGTRLDAVWQMGVRHALGGTSNIGDRWYVGRSNVSSNDLVVNRDGLVGVNTPSPTEQFDVVGNIKFSGALMPNNSAGTAGQVLTSAGPGVPPTWSAAGGGGWGLTGNSGTNISTNFIGTTDNVGLRFKTNNNNSGLIDPLTSNAFFGYLAGNATTGNQNVGIGTNALVATATGTGNVGIGTGALQTNTTGGNNIAIGNFADVSSSALSNAIAIGANASVGSSNSLVLGGTGANAVKVGIGSTSPSTNLEVMASVPTIRVFSTQTTSLSQSYVEFGRDDGAGNFTMLGSIGDTGSSDGLQLFSSSVMRFNTNFADRFAFGSSGELLANNASDFGTAGQVLTSAGGGAPAFWASPGASTGWTLTGNAVSAGDFIGTTNSLPLIFKQNNIQAGLVDGNIGSTFFGSYAGLVNTGNTNTGIGLQALTNNTTGLDNVALGVNASATNITGNENTIIGAYADVGTSGLNNATAIGSGTVVNTSNSVVLGNNANVGIGTSSPTQKLEINDVNSVGQDLASLMVYSNNNSASGSLIAEGNDTGTSAGTTIYSKGSLGVFATSPSGIADIGAAGHVNGSFGTAYGGVFSYGSDDPLTATRYSLLATSTHAGYFQGDVHVAGTLSKAGGSFKIDHPLDPQNKYLVHSFVESPDMMNVYNGNITTNSNGEATVQLPDYFEALNKDYRYQLTVIGTFAQAIILQKVQNNSFIIKTDKPSVEVSWQVTGIRKDPYAEQNRIVPEVLKAAEDRGKYLMPELYGRPKSDRVGTGNSTGVRGRN